MFRDSDPSSNVIFVVIIEYILAIFVSLFDRFLITDMLRYVVTLVTSCNVYTVQFPVGTRGLNVKIVFRSEYS